MTVESEDRGSGKDREGGAAATDEDDDDDSIEGNDDVKMKEDSDVYNDNGHDLKMKDAMMGMRQEIILLEELHKSLAVLLEIQKNYMKNMKEKTRKYRWSKTRTLERKRKNMEI